MAGGQSAESAIKLSVDHGVNDENSSRIKECK